VSVGGLTLGGAGKTPLAARLALGLRRRGWRVVLASGGYKGRRRDPVQIVSDGAHIHSSVAVSGDEALILAAHAPDVPVLVGRDRRIVGHHALALFDAEILVLDDGFQHHRLARDLDIVSVDGQAGFGNGHVIPWGPLREPLSSLRYADWVFVIDGESGSDPDPVVDWAARGGPVLRAVRRPSSLVSLDRRTREPLERLEGRAVGLLAGVARPQSVRRSLEALGARVVAERLFPDHHTYRPGDVADLDTGVDRWVTTEKDALKILPEWVGDARVSVLAIELELEDEPNVLERLEAHLLDRRPALASRQRSAS
jgi:tetraacyldisaccharide 4'-kinase